MWFVWEMGLGGISEDTPIKKPVQYQLNGLWGIGKVALTVQKEGHVEVTR